MAERKAPPIPASANKKYVRTLLKEETARLFPGVPATQVYRDELSIAKVTEAVNARYWKIPERQPSTTTYTGAIGNEANLTSGNDAPTDERSVMLHKMSVQYIDEQYHKGNMSAGDHTKFLREKARVELNFMLSEQGFMKTVVQTSVKNFIDGWENLKEAATHDTTPTISGDRESGQMAKDIRKDIGRELYYAGLAVWGQGQMLLSVMNAVGEVTGMKAEKAALSYGASPGAARVLGVIADVGTGVVPVAGTARLFAKGVQAVGAAAKGAGTAAKAVVDPAIQNALAVVSQGLALDGVQGARATMNRAVRSFNPAKADTKGVERIEELAKQTSNVPLINIQREAISFTDEVAKIAKDVTPEMASKALPGLMKRFGISYPDLKTIQGMWAGSESQAMTATQFYAHLTALAPRAAELGALAQRAIVKGASEKEQLDFVRAATQLFTGSSDRIVYSKEFTNLLLHWDPKSMASGDIQGAMRTFATDISKLAIDNPDGLAKLALKAQEGQGLTTSFLGVGQLAAGFRSIGGFGGLKEVYRNILLPLSSSPAVVSNSIASMNMILERAVGGTKLMDPLGGIREASYMIKGMAMATADSMTVLKMAAQIGTPGIVPGAVGYGVRLPTTATVGIDQAFKILNARGVQYADAIEEAMKQVASGALPKAQIGNFVNALAANPTLAMSQHANDIANRATFTNDLGWFATRISEVLQRGGSGGFANANPGTLWFAFMKSQINLVKYSWDRTPGLQLISGQLYDDILAGGARADDAIGRLTIASLQAMMIFEFAKDGSITGSGPVDSGLRAAWLAVNQPNSIKGSEGFIPYKGLSPTAQVVGMIADMVEIHDQLDDTTAGQMAMAVTYSIVNNLANDTWWRTMTDIVETVHHVSRDGKLNAKDVRTIMSPVTAVATGGPVGARIEQMNDPVLRDARNYIDAVKSRIPGWSADVPPRRDGYGDPLIPPQNIGSSWFGFFNPLVPRIKAYEDDKVKIEGAKLQVRLPHFEDSIGGTPPRDEDTDLRQALPEDKIGVKLTPQQRDRWQQMYRGILRHPEHGIEARLFNSDEYKRYDDGSSTSRAYRRQLFQTFLQESKALAAEALIMDDQQLGKKVLTNSVSRALPYMSETQQKETQEQVPEWTQLFETMSEEQKENFARYGALDGDQPFKAKPASIMGIQAAPAEYKPEPNLRRLASPELYTGDTDPTKGDIDLTITAPDAKMRTTP